MSADARTHELPVVLIIDDDRVYAEDLTAVLSDCLRCRHAASGEEGLGMIGADPPDAVVLDLMLEGRSGLEVLQAIRRTDPALPVILVTNHPSPETEVAALRSGALYYVRKAAGRQEVLAKLAKCLEVAETARDRDRLRREVGAAHAHFIASSPSLRRLETEIDRVARAPASTVLLLGESGSGKSLLAEEIHRRSPRSRGPFLRVNMAALREELIDSELFGHKKGAFTHAISERRGHFETARGGTLFLDEIGDLSLPSQARLLTVLDSREILPVGSSVPVRVDARLIAATSRDMPERIRAGDFRGDLYERLNVISLRVPPLREHPEDVPALVQYFLGRLLSEMALPAVRVTDEAVRLLQQYSWRKSNVRELKNALERALVLHGADGVLGPEAFDLPFELSPHGPDPTSGGLSYEVEKRRHELGFKRGFFEQAFREIGSDLAHPRSGDIARVAARVGVVPLTVRRILRELGVGRADDGM